VAVSTVHVALPDGKVAFCLHCEATNQERCESRGVMTECPFDTEVRQQTTDYMTGVSASQVTTLSRYTNTFIVIIFLFVVIIIIITHSVSFSPPGFKEAEGGLYVCDFFQINFLNIHETDLYQICSGDRTLSVHEGLKYFPSLKHPWQPIFC